MEEAFLVDWSRAQFALTAMYHWLFVPLTLGLILIVGIMETIYYKTNDLFWKRTTEFWMKLFGINFAIGVATGLILEFQFGTNWSNYSWFVGDIFGAPLAIEGLFAFFMESTFIAVMFFGWGKVSKGFHLAATWLTGLGATMSAWWILVANAWMQHPVGMDFNPVTVRHEMIDFWAVAFSRFAVNKFGHTVLSCWVVGAVFVVGVSAWYLWKNRDKHFAIASMKIGAIVGIVSSVLVVTTGDKSGYLVAKYQPMKFAAIEGLYEGEYEAGLSALGLLDPAKESYDDEVDPFLFQFKIPYLLSYLATRSADGFVPGIKDVIEGGYVTSDGEVALSAEEKMIRGRQAIAALARYREAMDEEDQLAMAENLAILRENINYFGYGYIKDVEGLIPNVPLNFYSFRVMVILGTYFIFLFALLLFLIYRKTIVEYKWVNLLTVWSIPLVYISSQAGWVVAETGRQPWTIQDMLPVGASVSELTTGAVQTTFYLFLILFTVMLAAEVSIMVRVIRRKEQFIINNA